MDNKPLFRIWTSTVIRCRAKEGTDLTTAQNVIVSIRQGMTYLEKSLPDVIVESARLFNVTLSQSETGRFREGRAILQFNAVWAGSAAGEPPRNATSQYTIFIGGNDVRGVRS